MTTITDAKLDELERLCNAATPGPWGEKASSVNRPWIGIYARLIDRGIYRGIVDAVGYAIESPNASFIAAARTALPELLAEVRRLRAETSPLRPLTPAQPPGT